MGRHLIRASPRSRDDLRCGAASLVPPRPPAPRSAEGFRNALSLPRLRPLCRFTGHGPLWWGATLIPAGTCARGLHIPSLVSDRSSRCVGSLKRGTIFRRIHVWLRVFLTRRCYLYRSVPCQVFSASDLQRQTVPVTAIIALAPWISFQKDELATCSKSSDACDAATLARPVRSSLM